MSQKTIWENIFTKRRRKKKIAMVEKLYIQQNEFQEVQGIRFDPLYTQKT